MRLFRKLFGAQPSQAASDQIRQRVESGRPLMVARLGATELECMVSYARGKGWSDRLARKIELWSGFFPATPAQLEKFCRRMGEDLKYVDILGSWLRGEKVFAPQLIGAQRVRLADLEPYYHARPWSEALRGKKVLVVHPFTKSIERQYAQREKLFSDPNVLPLFRLQTLPAVQSAGKASTTYGTWFEALDEMSERIARADFDVAILGCGAYGFPLAAHVKRLGKQAIHLGGSTQVLFGIRGRRWDEHPRIGKLINEHWVRPLPEEHPPAYREIEGGCYW